MRRMICRYVVLLTVMLVLVGCEALTGTKRKGEIQLSSETFGAPSYYTFGYSYEYAEYYKWRKLGEPFTDPVPDIINEATRVIEGSEVTLIPGFNTPGQMNGFALAGEFETLNEARDFYDGYSKVEGELQFETEVYSVELYQVWIQKTAAGNYAKLLIREIQNYEGELGNKYNVVTMDYTYQPNGSSSFPE